MRGMMVGLLVAIVISTIAVLAASVGALGVAAIGWLLHHWFDLTQWQGTLVALAVAAGLGFLVYKLATQAPVYSTWDEEAEEDQDQEEPPIVPWRRNRPTPGALPPDKQGDGERRRK